MDYTFKELETIFSNYRHLVRALEDERTNVLNPYIITDTNVGGSSSGRISNPTESTAIALVELEDDEEIKNHVKAIEKTYLKMDIEKQRMMRVFYFERVYGLRVDNVALKLNVDVRTLKRWRDCACNELRKQLCHVLSD